MRVAVVTTSHPRFEGDASGHFVATEARLLWQAGHEVLVVAAGDPPPKPDGSPPGPRVRWVGGGQLFAAPGAPQRLRDNPLRSLAAFRFVHSARAALQNEGPFDRIVAHWLVPSALPISLGLPAQVVAVGHGTDVRWLSALPKPVRQSLGRRLMRGTHAIRLVSHALKRQWVDATFPTMAQHCHVEPCPIRVRPRTRTETRAKLGVPAEQRLAVVVGRLIGGKRVDSALRSLSALPKLRTVVVGDGPERRGLSESFPGVTFLGHLHRERTLDWIAAADLLLSASESEGAPSVIREARALGVPVVARAVADLERWSHRDAGLWVVRPSEKLSGAPDGQLR